EPQHARRPQVQIALRVEPLQVLDLRAAGEHTGEPPVRAGPGYAPQLGQPVQSGPVARAVGRHERAQVERGGPGRQQVGPGAEVDLHAGVETGAAQVTYRTEVPR